MAILNNIRKHGIFLIIIIALALFSFVLSGVIGNGNTSKGSSDIATINGVDIPREDFMKKVEVRQRSLGANGGTNQAMNIVWQQELRRVILDEQYQKLGLTVEKAQINNALSKNLANNQAFQNEITGLFDNEKMQGYIIKAKEAAAAGNSEAYQSWIDFEENTSSSILEKNYFDLIKGGLITTLAEGKQEYHFQNDNINIEYVQIPYTKIADEDVPVTDAEIEKYVKAHAKDFEVAPQVDIQYVTFNEDPSPADIKETKAEVSTLISDFGATLDNTTFVNANSEVAYVDRWYFKSELPKSIADSVMTLALNKVYGPYKEGNSFGLTKVFETKQMADSAKARHILIRFEGLSTAPQDVVRTKEYAKELADSILSVAKRDIKKFETLAAKFSEDLSNKDKGGDLGYFAPGRMVVEFNDFIFDNNTGDIAVVETDFGFHIVEIEDQKNIQKAIKIANVIKNIDPSEETINSVFSEATKFEIAAKSGDFDALSKEANYTVKPVNKIGELDANVPGIGENRSIVSWAFNKETKIGDIKRVSVPKGYVLVQLTRRNPKGLLSIAESSPTVTPILRNEKKAAQISASISSSDIKEVASSQNVTVKTASAITMANPTIAGIGAEPKAIGAAFGKKVGETTKLIAGEKGVYMVRMLAVNISPDMPDYSSYANQLNTEIAPAINTNVYKALENASKIVDNRADFY